MSKIYRDWQNDSWQSFDWWIIWNYYKLQNTTTYKVYFIRLRKKAGRASTIMQCIQIMIKYSSVIFIRQHKNDRMFIHLIFFSHATEIFHVPNMFQMWINRQTTLRNFCYWWEVFVTFIKELINITFTFVFFYSIVIMVIARIVEGVNSLGLVSYEVLEDRMDIVRNLWEKSMSPYTFL